ncbi:MAG: response regulator [Sulfurimonas sp.]|nr:response regulator [Sulfurimonas sp.]
MSNFKQLREDLSPICVLYVEDEEKIRDETLKFLKKIFSCVDSAINGEEGLKLFKEKEYRLVIADLKMPKMNGREMLSKIRELNENTVSIVMSASDSNIDMTTTVCDAYMNKPVEFMEFIKTLESLRNKLLSNPSQ